MIIVKPNNIARIVELCLEIDQAAYSIYMQLSELSEDAGLIAYWDKISMKQYDHIRLWKELSSYAQKGLLPPIFDDGESVEQELEEQLTRVKRLGDAIPKSISDQFMAAYWLEFYLMHYAFAKIYHFAEIIGYNKNPHDSYDNHIDDFIYMLNKYNEETPERRLIAETLKRLWADNRKWVSLTSVDDLTSAFNQKGFYESVIPLSHFARRKDEVVGIVKLKIDGFNEINEEYGRFTIEQILRQMGKNIKSTLRHSDIIGRFDYDEFALFLNNINEADFEMVLRKIQESILNNSSSLYDITVGIGGIIVSFKSHVEETLLDSIQQADQLLEKAQALGKSQLLIKKPE